MSMAREVLHRQLRLPEQVDKTQSSDVGGRFRREISESETTLSYTAEQASGTFPQFNFN